MKKVYALALLCIPLCLVLGFRTIQPSEGDTEQEQQVPEQGYSFESGYYSMQELGKLLERFGREIQQDGSVTVAGKSYPITGFGQVEINVGGRGIFMQIGSGETAPPTEGETYEIYKRSGLGATPSEVAEFLAKMGENLASSGNIAMEDYSIALEGTATVTQRMVENRGGRQRHTYLLDIAFGQGDLPRPDDEEDMQERVELGETTVLAEREFTDVNQARLARLFASLSRDLRAGRVSVGDREVPAGELARGAVFMHSIATDGQSQRVSISFQFGEVIPRPEQVRPQPDEPRYGKETIERVPIREIGELLKRIGTEILESGTITFEGFAYRAGQSGGFELGMRHDRLNIELGTNATPPPPQ